MCGLLRGEVIYFSACVGFLVSMSAQVQNFETSVNEMALTASSRGLPFSEDTQGRGSHCGGGGTTPLKRWAV